MSKNPCFKHLSSHQRWKNNRVNEDHRLPKWVMLKSDPHGPHTTPPSGPQSHSHGFALKFDTLPPQGKCNFFQGFQSSMKASPHQWLARAIRSGPPQTFFNLVGEFQLLIHGSHFEAQYQLRIFHDRLHLIHTATSHISTSSGKSFKALPYLAGF